MFSIHCFNLCWPAFFFFFWSQCLSQINDRKFFCWRSKICDLPNIWRTSGQTKLRSAMADERTGNGLTSTWGKGFHKAREKCRQLLMRCKAPHHNFYYKWLFTHPLLSATQGICRLSLSFTHVLCLFCFIHGLHIWKHKKSAPLFQPLLHFQINNSDFMCSYSSCVTHKVSHIMLPYLFFSCRLIWCVLKQWSKTKYYHYKVKVTRDCSLKQTQEALNTSLRSLRSVTAYPLYLLHSFSPDSLSYCGLLSL